MPKERRKSNFEKEQARFIATGKWMAEDWKKKKKLTREFLRTPYGLEVKKNDRGHKEST